MTRAAPWDADHLPDLDGMTVVVTGSNSGIGREVAAALAGAGATAVLACRNVDKAEAARADIVDRGVRGDVDIVRLDLASQAQIADAAAELLDRFPSIDRLVNNAGVMAERREETEDGFELLFGTNHLGHFAFTGRILPAILAAPNSRVVTVTSMSHRFGKLHWDDLQLTKRFRRYHAYAQSKLATSTHAIALQRRLTAAGEDTTSLVSDPGFADTDILEDAGRNPGKLERRIGDRFTQTPAEAAHSVLRATTDPYAYGGEFYAPGGRLGVNGPPVVANLPRRALDEDAQRRLWDVSVELTGVEYPLACP